MLGSGVIVVDVSLKFSLTQLFSKTKLNKQKKMWWHFKISLYWRHQHHGSMTHVLCLSPLIYKLKIWKSTKVHLLNTLGSLRDTCICISEGRWIGTERGGNTTKMAGMGLWLHFPAGQLTPQPQWAREQQLGKTCSPAHTLTQLWQIKRRA